MSNVLNIIETAYRATLEEQDDTVVWISHALRGAGADVDLLLRGDAVNYAVPGQDASGLGFGEWTQRHPPDLAGDLRKFAGKGGKVFFVQEDARARGLDKGELLGECTAVSRGELAALFDRYDRVWQW